MYTVPKHPKGPAASLLTSILVSILTLENAMSGILDVPNCTALRTGAIILDSIEPKTGDQVSILGDLACQDLTVPNVSTTTLDAHQLILAHDPATAMEAATKQYVDAASAAKTYTDAYMHVTLAVGDKTLGGVTVADAPLPFGSVVHSGTAVATLDNGFVVLAPGTYRVDIMAEMVLLGGVTTPMLWACSYTAGEAVGGPIAIMRFRAGPSSITMSYIHVATAALPKFALRLDESGHTIGLFRCMFSRMK